MNKYTITVTESASGELAVDSVSKVTGVNQYKSISKPLPLDTFGFSEPANPRSLTKRASRKTR